MRERMAKLRAARVSKGNTEGNLFGPKKWEDRCKSFHRRNAQDIQAEQRLLRKITLRGNIGLPHIKKQIRLQLERISLMFAVDATSGDEFRKNVAVAMDLSGYKRQIVEKIKRLEAKKTARGRAQSDIADRQRMLEREQEQQGREERF